MTAQFDFTDVTYPASSWIDAVYYNKNSRALAVVANGRNYFYSSVPEYVFNNAGTGSAGQWYNYDVQGKFSTDHLPGTSSPDSPVNFVRVSGPGHVAVRPGAQLVQPKATADKSFRFDVDVTSVRPVVAKNLTEAIALFEADPSKYVTFEVSGVTTV